MSAGQAAALALCSRQLSCRARSPSWWLFAGDAFGVPPGRALQHKLLRPGAWCARGTQILLPSGAKDIPVGQPALVIVEDKASASCRCVVW